MAIYLASKRTSLANLRQQYGNGAIIDVTSRASEPWVKFSPFYPHGGIPVPFTPGRTAASVESVWQGLKVFEREDVDAALLDDMSFHRRKRGGPARGQVLGHRAGLAGDRLLGYAEARRSIYLPTYRWMLEYCVPDLVERLRRLSEGGVVTLLDYDTNADINNLSKPLSHAALIIHYINGTWPEEAGNAHAAATHS
jgi:hypothetical protein